MNALYSAVATVLFVLALLFGGALVLLVVTAPASADPVSVEWTNTAGEGVPEATHALLCAGTACSLAQTACAPGARCETAHDLPPGEYADAYLMISAPAEGWSWSLPVPGPLVVEPAEPSGGTCQHDADGNGVVTTADFSSFLSEMWNGCGGD